jgi:ABC-type methionine transport system ATPase subunit
MGAFRARLTFPAELVKEPVIARLARNFDVLPNIRQAKVEASSGWIVCELEGSPLAIEAAVSWLKDLGVQVDPLGDVVEG